MADRWTDSQIARLPQLAAAGLTAREAGLLLGRTAKAVSSYASAHHVSFDSGGGAGLRAFLSAGGVLVREDVGGSVGIAWTAAHRSAGAFPSATCEALAEAGVIVERDGVWAKP